MEKEKIACNWKDSCLENAGKIEKTENQQQEFIKYLEEFINKTDYEVNILGNYPYLAWSNTYKKVLEKYKEIIGDKINDRI